MVISRRMSNTIAFQGQPGAYSHLACQQLYPEMYALPAQTFEDMFAAVEGINPDATGDGHRLAASVGGQLCNMSITYGPELRFVPPSQKPF